MVFTIDLSHIKNLSIGNRVGSTEYIDFIKWEEVTDPVMKGVDCFGRSFLVVKFLINDSEPIMQTFFQRYSHYNSNWMGCGHATKLLFGVNIVSTIQSQFIEKIIQGEILETTEDITYEFPKVTKVELFDKNRWNAAIIIQRNWRECRYNPMYKLCEKVQMGNQYEIVNDINLF